MPASQLVRRCAGDQRRFVGCRQLAPDQSFVDFVDFGDAGADRRAFPVAKASISRSFWPREVSALPPTDPPSPEPRSYRTSNASQSPGRYDVRIILSAVHSTCRTVLPRNRTSSVDVRSSSSTDRECVSLNSL
jgi:hypothetical protein